MNKFYVLTIIFFAQPLYTGDNVLQALCGVLSQVGNCLPQTRINQKYFDADFVRELTKKEFESHMNDWMVDYGKTYLSSQQSTDSKCYEERYKHLLTQYAIVESAQAYQRDLREHKFLVTGFLSDMCIEPILKRLVNKMPVKTQIIGMPATAFVLGLLFEYVELTKGHAFFDRDIKRTLCSPKEAFARSLSVAKKDLKIAAVVGAFETSGDLAMRISGGYNTLASVYEHLEKLLPFLKGRLDTLYFICNLVVRKTVYNVVYKKLYSPDRDYVKYLNQPEFERLRRHRRQYMFE